MKSSEKTAKNLETFDVPEGTKSGESWKSYVEFSQTPIIMDEYERTGKEKYPSRLHEAEIEALKVVVEMAKGNLHCRQTQRRKDAIEVVNNMIGRD